MYTAYAANPSIKGFHGQNNYHVRFTFYVTYPQVRNLMGLIQSLRTAEIRYLAKYRGPE